MSTLNLGDSLISDTDYSTSEKKTGATWINGKPIYSKYVDCIFASSANADGDTAHNISNIETVVRVEAFTPSGFRVPMPFATNLVYGMLYVSNTVVRLQTNASGYLNTHLNVVIFYTKTTD